MCYPRILVTAAVVGIIVNLALWISIHAFFADVSPQKIAGATIEVPVLASVQVPSLLITLVAAILVFRLRASVPITLLVTGALGMLSFLM